MSNASMDVDRLSNMPEEVLSHILSLMPTKFAVQTSIVSKRLRYSWRSVTNLDFDDGHPIYSLPILSIFMDWVLKLIKTPQINLFRLRFSNELVRKSSVSKWIDEAVRLNVCEVDFEGVPFELPVSLLTCKTLTKLRLVTSKNSNYFDNWKCRSPANLPCLKTLDIVVSIKPSNSVLNLINGCPILENLFVKLYERYQHEEFNFNIPTLRQLRLTLPTYEPVFNNVVLNVPNLEYLFVGGSLCSPFVMEDLSSLIEAKISVKNYRGFNHLLVELLKGLSGVQSLSLFFSSGNVQYASPLPMFPNLKHLELLSCYPTKWQLIPQFLENSSELEHLCIETVLFKVQQPGECWIEPERVPTCMLKKLRTIKFLNYQGWDCGMKFLEYMLGNAEVLKTLTITFDKSWEEQVKCKYAQLLKHPRASINCEIYFHANRFHSCS